ncbi:hypothetical protein [Larkinella knui]|uniref:Cohesin domain-containing protein n=1 Tax=Larkinella knui TaxID=2025310 RepID=A0A3P1CLM2_9BACT|nr:hypothetical protein [Larkinella knui]RRB14080.1 hypothetical protein EHT87_17720 [Larkinella knui]
MKKKIYLLAGLFLFFVSASFAQNGKFDVRFLVKTIDCTTGKAVINVQVKASNAPGIFLMGDANYRFDYDPRIINNPVILTQENFSSQAPASDVRYGVQNLNGSTFGATKGTVSLNTIYGGSGTGAASVGTDWITVSTIQFDIVNTQLIQNNCFAIVWHTNAPADFPSCGKTRAVFLISIVMVTSIWMPTSTLSTACCGRKITDAILKFLTDALKGPAAETAGPFVIRI